MTPDDGDKPNHATSADPNRCDASDSGAGGSSRLMRHYALLGLKAATVSEAELAAERQAMREAKPLPLTFPSATTSVPAATATRPTLRTATRRKRLIAGAPLLIGVAAAVVLLVLSRRSNEPAWRVMGSGSVQVSVEQDGRVQAWTPQLTLRAGDRVKVEIVASEPAVAYWAVVSRDRRLLSEVSWVRQSRLEVNANERKSFVGSLQLVGESEGETLAVLVCGSRLLQTVVNPDAAIQHAWTAPNLPPELAGCKLQRFRLRP